MPKLIKDKAVVDDNWQILEATDAPEAVVVPDSEVIVPLNVWKAQQEQLQGRKSTLGVWLDSEQLAEELAADAVGFAVIALNFPTFMDGRAFSTARLLRERYGYQGDIRAIGYIIRDQLFYMSRCGFTSFKLPEGNNLEAALESFNDFSESYQAAVDQPQPLFRRRA